MRLMTHEVHNRFAEGESKPIIPPPKLNQVFLKDHITKLLLKKEVPRLKQLGYILLMHFIILNELLDT